MTTKTKGNFSGFMPWQKISTGKSYLVRLTAETQITLVVKNVMKIGKIMNTEDEEFARLDKKQADYLLKSLGFPDHRSPKKKEWVNLNNDEIQAVADEVQFGYHAHYDKEFIDAIQEALRKKNET